MLLGRARKKWNTCLAASTAVIALFTGTNAIFASAPISEFAAQSRDLVAGYRLVQGLYAYTPSKMSHVLLGEVTRRQMASAGVVASYSEVYAYHKGTDNRVLFDWVIRCKTAAGAHLVFQHVAGNQARDGSYGRPVNGRMPPIGSELTEFFSQGIGGPDALVYFREGRYVSRLELRGPNNTFARLYKILAAIDDRMRANGSRIRRPGVPAAAGAPVFHSAMEPLRSSVIPVYLPAWVPRSVARGVAHGNPFGRPITAGYDVMVTTSQTCIAHVCELLDVNGRRGHARRMVTAGSHRVNIGTGGAAFLDPNPHTNYGWTLTWYFRGNSYVLYYNDPKVLLRMGRSFVRVL